MKKRVLILSMLLSTGAVFAVNNEWTGNGNGFSWNDVNNWNKGRVPDAASSDVAIIRGTDGAVTMASTPSTNPNQTWLANSGGALKTLTITNATVNLGTARIGYDRSAWTGDGAANGLLTINTGSAVTAGNLEIGAADTTSTAGATGLVVLNDGTLAASQAIVGKSANTTGILTINGGAATFSTLKLASDAAATGTLNLNGGTLDFTNWSGTGHDIINVSLGSLTAGADKTGRIQGLASAGDLAATGGLLDDAVFSSIYTSNSGSFVSGAYTAKWGYDATSNKTALWAVAIPEPATLGLVAAFGGGMLLVRRRFMI